MNQRADQRGEQRRGGVAEVGLDDLFGAPRPPAWAAPPPAGSPARRWLLGRLFFSVALAAVIYGLLYLVRLTAPYPLLAVTIFVITLIKYALARVAVRPLPPQLTGRGLRSADSPSGIASGVGGAGGAPDGLDLAVGGWAERLDRASRDTRLYRQAILPRLGELVDERLRMRHGVTRATDPERAREMMGEHLWRTLHDPSTGTPRDMALLVSQIEEL